MGKSGRYHQENHLPHEKTLRIVFLTEIEYFAKIRFLMGNDLETSEVLYSSLFYIKSKERIYAYKDSKLFPSNTNNLN